MRILYLGKHDSGFADDEGAITFALEALGHRAERLREKRASVAFKMRDVDFCLYHHCHDYGALSDIRCPKVMWGFDLISYPDALLEKRNRERLAWMRQVAKVADLIFLTDGDFVAQDASGKLHWLPQGADERVVGVGSPDPVDVVPLLFTGIGRGGGRERVEFVLEMEKHYASHFRHVQRGVYGRDLADLIASTQIVVAPSGPVTGHYWSNRVWNVLGFGGFLLHPYSEGLARLYADGREIVYYHDMRHLHELIAHYLVRPDDRWRIAAAGLKRTQEQHLYRHRCQRLIEIVKERLGL